MSDSDFDRGGIGERILSYSSIVTYVRSHSEQTVSFSEIDRGELDISQDVDIPLLILNSNCVCVLVRGDTANDGENAVRAHHMPCC